MKNYKLLGLTLGVFASMVLASCGGTSTLDPTNEPTLGPTEVTPTDTPTGGNTEVEPTIPEVIDGEAPKGTKYKKYDRMYDFSFEGYDGFQYSLKEELNSKEVVILNFWASWCGPCQMEFPVLEEGFEKYEDKVTIFALSSEKSDTMKVVKDIAFNKQLSFPMSTYHPVIDCFDTSAIPVSVVIDRYGMVMDIEVGAITQIKKFEHLVNPYLGPDYKPYSPDEPDVDVPTDSEPSIDENLPNVEAPSSKDIENLINDPSYTSGYYGAVGEDEKYNWPWVIDTKEQSIYPSNKGKDSSYSIINSKFTVENPENQVLTFDFYSSTEKDYDVLYILIDGQPIQKISGLIEEWLTCYAYVSLEPGEHVVSLAYIKDADGSDGQDRVLINNMRFVSISEINVPTYIKRDASRGLNEQTHKYTKYITPVFNETDGYYHVDKVDGPLLLAELRLATNFSDKITLLQLAQNDKCTINGKDYNSVIMEYANYAANNSYELTPVTKTLKEAIEAVTNTYGDDLQPNQWLEVCIYLQAYAAPEIESPIKGLAMFDPLSAHEGNDNLLVCDRPLMPMGKYLEFIPSKTGAYKITADSIFGTWGEIYSPEFKLMSSSTEFSRNKITAEIPGTNIEMYGYLEEGKSYLIRAAFDDPAITGEMTLTIEYVGQEAKYLVVCSEPFFTVPDGEDMSEDNVISRGVKAQLNEADGIYYHVNEKGSLDSKIYTDIDKPNTLFGDANGKPLTFRDLVTIGAFDFSKNELGEPIEGENLTELAKTYLDKAIVSDDETNGMLEVDAQLQMLLQKLMDKYTFPGVEGSWLKLCYYFDIYNAQR